MEVQNLESHNIKVLHSNFIQSAQNIHQAPCAYCTEVAILGRSNVGKSSIINLLLQHKLAKSSSTPGKTKLINFFATTWEVQGRKDTEEKEDVNIRQNSSLESIQIPLMLIDFPGFGYAKVDKMTKKVWDKNLSDFIYKRQSIKLFCHLIDSRHQNLAIDSEIMQFLESILEMRKDCAILQIYTKDDKLKKNDLHRLRMQGKPTISTLKKSDEKLQTLYKVILKNSLDWK